MELTVLTQNILGRAPLWEFRKRRLAEVISKVAPDIVSLQEVMAESPFAQDTQAHELAALVGGYDVDFAPSRIEAGQVAEGVALLHRHRLTERNLTALTLDPTDRWDRSNPRVVLSSVLELADLRAHVFAIHLSLSRKARARTLTELAQAVAAARERTPAELTLILGDFNAPPAEEALNRLCSATHEPWLDVWAIRHGAAGGHTWPTPLPCRRIDYVFAQLSREISILDCKRVVHAGSDHCALWARLRRTAH
jgi:endonuclease/exonuclease/phosphatase family metal-dependent hydrolase